MSDFPGLITKGHTVIHTFGFDAVMGQALMCASSVGGNAGWPTANKAFFIPFEVETTVVAYKMIFNVSSQSGNYDIGLYSETGTRLVSTGSTAVPAAGAAMADISNTTLVPGTYFMALNVDNTTASIGRNSALGTPIMQICGMQQQALGAVTLPNPATFANPTSAYVPGIGVAVVDIL